MNEVQRATPNDSRILAIVFMPNSDKTASIPMVTAKLMISSVCVLTKGSH